MRETNAKEVNCARCDRLIPAGCAVGCAGDDRRRHGHTVRWLCWRCNTPYAIKGFWTFDRAAAERRRQLRRGLAS